MLRIPQDNHQVNHLMCHQVSRPVNRQNSRPVNHRCNQLVSLLVFHLVCHRESLLHNRPGNPLQSRQVSHRHNHHRIRLVSLLVFHLAYHRESLLHSLLGSPLQSRLVSHQQGRLVNHLANHRRLQVSRPANHHLNRLVNPQEDRQENRRLNLLLLRVNHRRLRLGNRLLYHLVYRPVSLLVYLRTLHGSFLQAFLHKVQLAYQLLRLRNPLRSHLAVQLGSHQTSPPVSRLDSLRHLLVNRVHCLPVSLRENHPPNRQVSLPEHPLHPVDNPQLVLRVSHQDCRQVNHPGSLLEAHLHHPVSQLLYLRVFHQMNHRRLLVNRLCSPHPNRRIGRLDAHQVNPLEYPLYNLQIYLQVNLQANQLRHHPLRLDNRLDNHPQHHLVNHQVNHQVNRRRFQHLLQDNPLQYLLVNQLLLSDRHIYLVHCLQLSLLLLLEVQLANRVVSHLGIPVASLRYNRAQNHL
jgi:hypothetical protein